MPAAEAPADMMTPELHAASRESVVVITSEGRVLKSGRASLFVLEKTGWGWFAKLLSLPPFVWVVEIIYRLIANNRGRISRFLRR